MADTYRSLPSVDKLLADRRLQPLEAAYSRQLVTDAVRQVLEASRSSIAKGQPAPSSDQLVASVSQRLSH